MQDIIILRGDTENVGEIKEPFFRTLKYFVSRVSKHNNTTRMF